MDTKKVRKTVLYIGIAAVAAFLLLVGAVQYHRYSDRKSRFIADETEDLVQERLEVQALSPGGSYETKKSLKKKGEILKDRGDWALRKGQTELANSWYEIAERYYILAR